MQELVQIPQVYKDLINQIFEIEKKAGALQEANSINRNINRIKGILETDLLSVNGTAAALVYHNPIGEIYNETRTDCDASISGASADNLEIIEVLKPIIRINVDGRNFIVQKALVIAETKK